MTRVGSVWWMVTVTAWNLTWQIWWRGLTMKGYSEMPGRSGTKWLGKNLVSHISNWSNWWMWVHARQVSLNTRVSSHPNQFVWPINSFRSQGHWSLLARGNGDAKLTGKGAWPLLQSETLVFPTPCLCEIQVGKLPSHPFEKWTNPSTFTWLD